MTLIADSILCYTRWPALRWLLSGGVFVTFAAVVFWLHGSEPPLTVDHIAYFKLANEIALSHSDGNYWRSISSVQSYGVLLAYLNLFTGDHVLSLKWLLAAMTVAYLFSAEYFFSACFSRPMALIMALVSAMHVSFGAMFWGMTDFSASLARSVVIPPMMLLFGWYIRHHETHRRFLCYPVLIILSVLHLGTYYLLALLISLDALRLLAEVRLQKTVRQELTRFLGMLALAGVVHLSLVDAGLINAPTHSLLPRIDAAGILPQHNTLATMLDAPAEGRTLSSAMAWEMEMQAQPWRLFPPPWATILGTMSSALFLTLISIGCGCFAIAKSGRTKLDCLMLRFAGCVILGSFGLQFTLWILRLFIPVYPVNFEEVRMITYLVIPLLYFAARGITLLYAGDALHRPHRFWAGLAVTMLVVQPIHGVRIMPLSAREWVFKTLVSVGCLDEHESQRNAFVREHLKLAASDEKLYYPILPVLKWLGAVVAPSDRILTGRDDLYLLPARVLGTSNGFLATSSASQRRLGWFEVRQRLIVAIRHHDLPAVIALGKDCQATYAVVPWPVPEAVFQANGYSVLQLPHNPS